MSDLTKVPSTQIFQELLIGKEVSSGLLIEAVEDYLAEAEEDFIERLFTVYLVEKLFPRYAESLQEILENQSVKLIPRSEFEKAALVLTTLQKGQEKNWSNSGASDEYFEGSLREGLLGIIALILRAEEDEDSGALQQALKIVQKLLHTLMPEGTCLLGFAIKESQYIETEITRLHYVLGIIFQKYGGDLPIAAQRLMAKFSNDLFAKPLLLTDLLIRYFDVWKPRLFYQGGVVSSPIRLANFTVLQEKLFTVAISNQGRETGLAAVSKRDQLFLTTIGPHLRPIGQPKQYGITCNGRLGDLRGELYQEKGHIHYEMWNQITYNSEDEWGKNWIWFEAVCYKEKLVLKARFESFDKEPSEAAFAFFCRAENLMLEEGKSLLPGTLSRFQGKIQPVYLQCKGEEFKITSEVEGGLMEIIPLAGDGSFWHSDFLIAYFPSHPNDKLTWVCT